MTAQRTRTRYPTERRIARFVQLARELGLDPGGFEAAPDGTVRVLPKAAAPATEFDRWAERL